MARKVRSEDALQSALWRFGDAAFRIAYMHTKKPRDTREVLEDVFTQYVLYSREFKNEAEERFWILKTTHQACMDYYARKLRKKLSNAQIQQAGRNLPFNVSNELCTILTLPYAFQTILSLCFGEEESIDFAARVIGRPSFLLRRRLEKVCTLTKLSEEDLKEWVQTIQMPDDLRSRIQYAIMNAMKDKHFSVNSRASALKRNLDHAIPYAALGVIVVCVVCVVGVRSGWFGTAFVRTPDSIPGGNTPIEITAKDESSAETSVSLPESKAPANNNPLAKLDLSIYIPDEAGLVQYTYTGIEADASLIVEEMAQKGAFPTDVKLEDLLYIRNGKVVSALKSGEQIEVRLLFSSALQDYLDTAPTTAALEAIAKTFHAFYDAANMPLAKLEIYSGDTPVTVDGKTIDCTALIHGELPVTGVVEEAAAAE